MTAPRFLGRVLTSAGDTRLGVADGDSVHLIEGCTGFADCLQLRLADLRAAVETATSGPPVRDVGWLVPMDRDMVAWAAGVTYERSRDARLEESGEADIYRRVYDAERPEIFYKAAAWQAVTSGDPVGRRIDSGNDTPEPELALVINRHGEIVGYGVANDMSSREIEGENALYLPQAKSYLGAFAIAPTIRPVWEIDDPYSLTIAMRIERDGSTWFDGTASTRQLRRRFDELVDHLFRHQAFPDGVVLSTGTCLVPPLDEPTLDGDVVHISIDGVGTLVNEVSSEPLDRWLLARRSDALARPS